MSTKNVTAVKSDRKPLSSRPEPAPAYVDPNLRFKPQIDKNSEKMAAQGRERIMMKYQLQTQIPQASQEFDSGQQRIKTPDKRSLATHDSKQFMKRSSSVYDNLYEATKARQKAKEAKIVELSRKKSIQEMEGCTFKPTLVSKERTF